MNKNILSVLIVVVLAGVILFLALSQGKRSVGNLDNFAKCLADRGFVMYGADWCPHCQNEKKALGDSFKFVSYVECPDNPKICIDAGIEGYPTWIVDGGKKLVGEQGLLALSSESGCALEQNAENKKL